MKVSKPCAFIFETVSARPVADQKDTICTVCAHARDSQAHNLRRSERATAVANFFPTVAGGRTGWRQEPEIHVPSQPESWLTLGLTWTSLSSPHFTPRLPPFPSSQPDVASCYRHLFAVVPSSHRPAVSAWQSVASPLRGAFSTRRTAPLRLVGSPSPIARRPQRRTHRTSICPCGTTIGALEKSESVVTSITSRSIGAPVDNHPFAHTVFRPPFDPVSSIGVVKDRRDLAQRPESLFNHQRPSL